MELSEFVAEKRALERDLARLIAKRVEEFKATTGHSPSAVSVFMVGIERMGAPRSEYVVDSVRTDVSIE